MIETFHLLPGTDRLADLVARKFCKAATLPRPSWKISSSKADTLPAAPRYYWLDQGQNIYDAGSRLRVARSF